MSKGQIKKIEEIEAFKPQIERVAEKYNLSLVLLYGSIATERAHSQSDVDIAVLKKEQISFRELVDLNNEFMDIFGIDEIDVKSLNGSDALFRYYVMHDGILLYGDSRLYNSFKMYAFRDYCEKSDLLKLKKALARKRIKDLSKV